LPAVSVASLRCYKCSNGYAYTPIYPCKRNHVLCSECRISRYCKCGKKFQKTTCPGLERLAEEHLRPCENAARGCKKHMTQDGIIVHQEQCDFKDLVCSSLVGTRDCSWAGIRKEMVTHLTEKHSEIKHNDFMYNFAIENYSQVEEFRDTVLLVCFGHFFLAKLEYNGKEAFYGGVQLVSGVPRLESVFRYEFELGKESIHGVAHYKFMFSRQTHTILEKYSGELPSNRCDHFWFRKDVGSFFTDRNDTLTVTVIVKSVQSLAMRNVEAQRTYGFVPSQYCQRCVTSFNPSPLV